MKRKRLQLLRNYAQIIHVKIIKKFTIIIKAEFTTYINYTRNLDFEQEPDYNYLRGLFKKVMEDRGLQHDYIYDWAKKDNNITNLNSNNENTTVYAKNRVQTSRPVTGNNFTHQNVNIKESIFVNNHNNQMTVDDKFDLRGKYFF
jgi:hypothetical protein